MQFSHAGFNPTPHFCFRIVISDRAKAALKLLSVQYSPTERPPAFDVKITNMSLRMAGGLMEFSKVPSVPTLPHQSFCRRWSALPIDQIGLQILRSRTKLDRVSSGHKQRQPECKRSFSTNPTSLSRPTAARFGRGLLGSIFPDWFAIVVGSIVGKQSDWNTFGNPCRRTRALSCAPITAERPTH